jgi:hypothetical protein
MKSKRQEVEFDAIVESSPEKKTLWAHSTDRYRSTDTLMSMVGLGPCRVIIHPLTEKQRARLATAEGRWRAHEMDREQLDAVRDGCGLPARRNG